MIWQNWSEFFAMGGYALYVWGSLAVSLVLMVGELVLVGRREAHIRGLLGKLVAADRRPRERSQA